MLVRFDKHSTRSSSKLVGNAKAATRKFPRDIGRRAHHTAGAAFYATLEGDLHGSAILCAVGAYGAELNTGLVLAIDTNLGVNDLKMGFMLICEILERH